MKKKFVKRCQGGQQTRRFVEGMLLSSSLFELLKLLLQRCSNSIQAVRDAYLNSCGRFFDKTYLLLFSNWPYATIEDFLFLESFVS